MYIRVVRLCCVGLPRVRYSVCNITCSLSGVHGLLLAPQVCAGMQHCDMLFGLTQATWCLSGPGQVLSQCVGDHHDLITLLQPKSAARQRPDLVTAAATVVLSPHHSDLPLRGKAFRLVQDVADRLALVIVQSWGLTVQTSQ